MDYTFLSAEDRANMLKQRVYGLEQEHFQHEVNKQIASSLPASAETAKLIADSDEAQTVIEAGLTVVKDELTAIEAELPVQVEAPLEAEAPKRKTRKSRVSESE